MQSITINDKKYNLPTSFDELTILQYQRILDTDLTDNIKKNFHYISILLDVDINAINDLTLFQLQQINTAFQFLHNEIPSTKVVNSITLKDGLTLYLNKNFQELSLGEFVDLDTLFKEDIVPNIHKIIAILYRPKKEESFANTIYQKLKLSSVKLIPYDSTLSNNLAPLIQDQVSISTALSAALFFCNIVMTYSTDLSTSSGAVEK
jgi:hypothetical protein